MKLGSLGHFHEEPLSTRPAEEMNAGHGVRLAAVEFVRRLSHVHASLAAPPIVVGPSRRNSSALHKLVGNMEVIFGRRIRGFLVRNQQAVQVETIRPAGTPAGIEEEDRRGQREHPQAAVALRIE